MNCAEMATVMRYNAYDAYYLEAAFRLKRQNFSMVFNTALKKEVVISGKERRKQIQIDFHKG
jgi:hypothetical protein